MSKEQYIKHVGGGGWRGPPAGTGGTKLVYDPGDTLSCGYRLRGDTDPCDPSVRFDRR